MGAKCTGLMGRIFGHKLLVATECVGELRFVRLSASMGLIKEARYFICQRCGAVTGEKK